MSFNYSDYNDLSSWRITDIVINPLECYELDFLDTRPNTFIIQNPNDERLLVGLSTMPTENNYEYDVSKNSTKPFGRPTRTNKLYILNTGMVEVNIKVFSVYKEFDISCLSGTSVTIENAEIKTEGIVNGFKTGVSLPSGSNKIGKVDIANFSNLVTSIEEIVNYSDTTLKNFLTTEIANVLYTLYGSVKDIATMTGDLKGLLATLNNTLTLSEDTQTYYKNNVIDFSVTADENVIVFFEWLTNDGGKVATLYIDDTDIFTMLENEKVTDLKIELNKGQTLRIESTQPMYRMKYYFIKRGI